MARKKRNNAKVDAADARREASQGNYQDAFADKERGKGAKRGKGGRGRGGSQSNGRRQLPAGYKYRDKGGNNDGSMYSPTAQTLNDVTNIPVSYILGKPFPKVDKSFEFKRGSDTLIYMGAQEGQLLPGIMSMYIVQTLGDEGSPASPINIAANTIYNHIRATNSRAAKYEPNDLMLAIYAVTQPYLYLKFLQRAYGIINNGFSMLDKYTPEALIKSMGLDYNDLVSNLSDFRTYMNFYALQIAQFPIPAGMEFFNRLDFLYSNVYVDTESVKPQYYIYNPMGFYVYEEAGADVSASLTFRDFAFANGTELLQNDFISVQQWGKNLLNPIYYSEQTKDMFADMINAFGSSLVGTTQIAETFVVSPIYRPEVMSQIENADILGLRDFQGEITKNSGINNSYIKQTLTARTMLFDAFQGVVEGATYNDQYPFPRQLSNSGLLANIFNVDSHLVNFHINNPSRDDIMVATRLMCNPYVRFTKNPSEGNLMNRVSVVNSGVEIVASAAVFYYDANYTLQSMHFGQNVPSEYAGESYARRHANDTLLSLIGAFDWHPKIRFAYAHMTNVSTSAPTQFISGFTFGQWHVELDNFTIINAAELENMHTSAKYGLFMPRNLSMR